MRPTMQETHIIKAYALDTSRLEIPVQLVVGCVGVAPPYETFDSNEDAGRFVLAEQVQVAYELIPSSNKPRVGD